MILHGIVNAPAGSATVQWKLYSGPNEVVFGSMDSADTSVSFTQPGSYVFELSASDGVHAVAYDAVAISVMPPVRMANISTRAAVSVAENVSIGGFIVQGTDPKEVLIRAIGPSLSELGVPGALADPVLELHDASGNVLLLNDNWKESQEQAIRDTGLAPGNDRESAIRTTLDPGSYTAVVAGKNNTSGIGLTEIYEVQQSGSRLLNISTRGSVGTGDGGHDWRVDRYRHDSGDHSLPRDWSLPRRSRHHESVTRPNARSFRRRGLDNSQRTTIGRSRRKSRSRRRVSAPPNESEAALLIDLNPGSYTAVVQGANATSGVALIEAYHLP